MCRLVPTVLATLLLVLGAAEADAHRRHHSHHHSHGWHSHGWHGGGHPALALAWGRAYPYAHRYAYPPRYPYAALYDPFYPDGHRPGLAAVVVEREPMVYVERERSATDFDAPGGPAPLWFYCPEPAGYYPHVPRCPERWVTVDPTTLAEPTKRSR